LPIVAAVGLLTVGIVALVNASQAEQKEIDGMREAAKALSEQAQETKKTIDGLKSALNGYEDAVKTLRACTEGTDE
jgi:peptidoglycan hydrolase CwlO-like protein